MSTIFSLIVSLIGNLSLSAIFLIVLLNPSQNLNFTSSYGFFIFLTEFISLHSGLSLAAYINDPRHRPKKIEIFVLIAVYSLITIMFGLLMENVFPTLLFTISLITKFLWTKAVPGPSKFILPMIVFVLLAAMVTFEASTLGRLFPLTGQTKGIDGGAFDENPSALLVWGVLYYFMLSLIELGQYYLNRRKKSLQAA